MPVRLVMEELAEQSSELDPAARWLQHYEDVERRRRALEPAQRRLRIRLPSPRTRSRAVATLIAVCVVVAGAAFILLRP